MLINLLKHIIVLFILLFLQIAVAPNLPDPFLNINFILTVLVFISIVYNFNYGVVYGIILAIFLDLFSPAFFGANIIAVCLTLYLIYKVFEHFLTNKSFYSLIGLTFLATGIFNLILFLYKSFYYIAFMKDFNIVIYFSKIALHELFWQIIFNIFLIFIAFVISHFVSHKFKTVFVDTTKS